MTTAAARPATAASIREACGCARTSCVCRTPKGNVHCPAHDDSTPSLSVTDGDKGVLVKCFAGCATGDVTHALGLELRDLFRQPLSASSRAGNGTDAKHRYELRDASGAHVATHTRVDFGNGRKTFSYSLPDGRRSLGGLSTSMLPLYGAERLREHVDEAVIVVEGEKSADAVLARGFNAVGTACGASVTPGDKALRPLLDHHPVILWPDNDVQGASHMNHIGTPVASLGATDVRIMDWPDAPQKGDAGDFCGSDEELVALLAASRSFVAAAEHDAASANDGRRHLKLVAASAIAPRPVKWLYEERIALGTLALIAGREGVGKTSGAISWVAAVTRGQLLGAYLGEPRNAIIGATEDSWAHVLVPRLIGAGADLDRVFRVDVITSEGGDGYLRFPLDIGSLETAVVEVQAVAIVLQQRDPRRFCNPRGAVMRLDEFLRHLHGVKKTGPSQRMARCPANVGRA